MSYIGANAQGIIASIDGGTISNATLDSTVTFPAGFLQKYAEYAYYLVNTVGGTNTINAWTKYPFNTEINNSDSLVSSFTSSEFTVSAGTYLLTAFATFHAVNGANIRFYDVTNTTALSYEFSDYVGNSAAVLKAIAKVTFSGTTTFRLEYYTETTRATDALGVDRGVNQQYGTLVIQKFT